MFIILIMYIVFLSKTAFLLKQTFNTKNRYFTNTKCYKEFHNRENYHEIQPENNINNGYHKKYNAKTFQYLSDVHVDTTNVLPDIIPVSNTLIIAGDIGNPMHKHFNLFFKHVSERFDTVIYTPGNHDFNSGCIFNKQKYQLYKPLINDIISKYKNVHCLDNNVYKYDDNTIIAGSILYTNPILELGKLGEYNNNNAVVDKAFAIHEENLISKYRDHTEKHKECIRFLTKTIDDNTNKDIIVVSHYVPTFALIEPKYMKLGPIVNSKNTTSLEHLMVKPIKAWISGHSHSVINKSINGIYCGINAYGNNCMGKKNKLPPPQTFTLY